MQGMGKANGFERKVHPKVSDADSGIARVTIHSCADLMLIVSLLQGPLLGLCANSPHTRL